MLTGEIVFFFKSRVFYIPMALVIISGLILRPVGDFFEILGCWVLLAVDLCFAIAQVKILGSSDDYLEACYSVAPDWKGV